MDDLALTWTNSEYLRGFLTSLKGKGDAEVREAINRFLGPGTREQRVARAERMFEHLEASEPKKGVVHGALKVLFYALC